MIFGRMILGSDIGVIFGWKILGRGNLFPAALRYLDLYSLQLLALTYHLLLIKHY